AQILVRGDVHAPAAQIVDMDIVKDGEEPGAKIGAWPPEMRARQCARQAILNQIIGLDTVAQQRTGVTSKCCNMLSQGRLHHLGRSSLRGEKAGIPNTNGKPRRIFQPIPMRKPSRPSETSTFRCDENLARNFCRPRFVIGFTDNGSSIIAPKAGAM